MKTCLFALALLPTLASAQAPLTLAKKFAADYQAATLKKDFSRFQKESTKDFAYIDGRGMKSGKDQAVAGMKAFYGSMTIKSFTAKAVSAKTAEGGIVYVQESKLAGTSTMFGPKPSVFNSVSRDEILMVKQGGRWLTKRVKNLKTDIKINGKPMKM